MIQVFFNDDEHTAKDGPYTRTLKTRKWLYLGSLAATIIGFNLFDADALSAVFPFIVAPTWLISQLVLVGLIYLLLQYVMLLVQLATTYDITLNDRLSFRRADELKVAFDTLRSAEASVNAISSAPSRGEEKDVEAIRRRANLMGATIADTQDAIQADEVLLAQLTENKSRRSVERSISMKTAQKQLFQARLEEVLATLTRIDKQVASGSTEKHDEAIQTLYDAQAAYRDLRKEDPASRRGYRLLETMIDFGRVVTPLIVSILAICRLIVNGPYA